MATRNSTARSQKGIYRYSYSNNIMIAVVDTATGTAKGFRNQRLSACIDLSMNAAVSPAGEFKGSSKTMNPLTN
jgi:hypothetical protein